jgi:hypothetical protein
LDWNTSPSNISFEGTFDLRATRFSKSPDGVVIDTQKLNQVFKGGVQAGVFSQAQKLPLPPDTAESLWQQKVDYQYAYSGMNVGGVQGHPLPDVAGALSDSSKRAVLSSGVGGRPVGLYDDVKATSLQELPHPPLVSSLSRTCGSDLNSVPSFVFQRVQDRFSLNFKGGDQVFCGLIAANELSVRLSGTPGQPFVIYGSVIAKRIRVQGSGNLIVMNPFASSTQAAFKFPGVGSLGLPSQNQIRAQLTTLGRTLAHNFFLLIFQSPDFPYPYSDPNLGSLMPQPATMKDAPPHIGQVEKCGGSGDWYCLRPAPVLDPGILFEKGDHEKLAYSIRVIQ